MQERFARILVTTDFSGTGDHAITHAFRLAADHGAEVLLCHVIDVLPEPNPLYAHYYPKDRFDPQRAAEETRAALLARMPHDEALARVPHRAVVGEGAAVEEILRIAAEEKVDLVVIATHGRSGLKHVLLGGVAERVIRHAHCPVLVVR